MLQMVKITNSVGFIDDSPGCSFIAVLKEKYVKIPFEKPLYMQVGFIYKDNKPLSKAAKNLISLVKNNI